MHHRHESLEAAVRCEESQPEPAEIVPRSYCCGQCFQVGEWGEGWMWYGSWKAFEDNPKSIEIYCSEECAHRAHPTRPIEVIDDLR